MSKLVTIWAIAIVVVAIVVDVLILMPTTSPSSTVQTFSTSSNWHTVVSGSPDLVEVTTASQDYYLIRSGDYISEGKHLAGSFFQDKTQLPMGEWVIEIADYDVSFTVISSTPIIVSQYAAGGAIFLTIFCTFVAGLTLFVVGLLVFD